MSEAVQFFDGMLAELKGDIHVAVMAEILTYDHVNMKADIQPLQGGLPPILDVPVSLQKAGTFFIRMPFKKGDRVVVLFSDYPLDDVGERGHSLDDAIIISGISEQSLPADHEHDMLIAHENMDTKIFIDELGKVSISTKTQDINIGSVEGNINITSQLGNVNVSGSTSSGSW